MTRPAPSIQAIYRRTSLQLIGALAVMAVIAWLLLPPATDPHWLARYFFVRQDVMVLAFIAAFALLGARLQAAGKALPNPRGVPIALLCLALILLCWIGHMIVFQSYALSRDEQMVGFDAAIYGSGYLFSAMPAEGREWWAALNQTFIMPIGDREGWVSSYLPVNALAFALAGAWAAPMFVAIGAFALWRIARRLWPESGGTQAAVLLLYAGSSQVIVTGMTPYAMSGHLALNLVWLALFLRGGRVGHAGAILVGLLATGLHQPIFHPLFVAPFLLLMMRRRQWRLLALYVVAYGAIGLFWLAWPGIVAAQATTALPAALNIEGVGYAERILGLTRGRSVGDVGLMAANLLRFVAWQHLLALPLAALGITLAARRNGIAGALALGLVLPVFALLLLLPYQGHGWGYRYMHGVIGNLVLLGGYGWRALEKRGLRPVFGLGGATAASLLLLLPVHAWQAHRQVQPYAAIDREIDDWSARHGIAVVVIDDEVAMFAQDLVRNRPDLSNRPLRLKASELEPAQLPALCQRGRLGLIGVNRLNDINAIFGTYGASTERFQRLDAAARAAGCEVRELFSASMM